MRERICINLRCEVGRERGIPGTPPVRATAVCFANKETDCPKTRAKLRISPWCWRIKDDVVQKEAKDE